jgi:hypothetical protein
MANFRFSELSICDEFENPPFEGALKDRDAGKKGAQKGKKASKASLNIA